jgi:hypothetical protein
MSLDMEKGNIADSNNAYIAIDLGILDALLLRATLLVVLYIEK